MRLPDTRPRSNFAYANYSLQFSAPVEIRVSGSTPSMPRACGGKATRMPGAKGMIVFDTFYQTASPSPNPQTRLVLAGNGTVHVRVSESRSSMLEPSGQFGGNLRG